MKTILLAIILTSLSVLTASSQIRIGLKGGYNILGVSGEKDSPLHSKNVSGFYVGPSIEFLFKQTLGIETALIYSQRNLKLENDEKMQIDYLDIPLNLKMYFAKSKNVNPYLSAGPYISFKISSNEKFTVNRDEFVDQWKAKAFHAGVNVGGGIQLYKHFQVGANYGLGLTENYKASDGKYAAKERILSISAGVIF